MRQAEKCIWRAVLAAAAALAVAGAAHAAEIEWLLIDEPGNPPNTAGRGSVAETFRISKHEITNAPDAEFLNAVAASAPNGLYQLSMTQSSVGGIDRNGSDGSYSYSAKAGFEDLPVNYVSWADAARYANWQHNGRPSGAQDASTTEDGAYTLPANDETVLRNPGAQYFLPTLNEWVKAGCYDPATDSYSSFPTRTFGAPFCTTPPNPPAGPGVANCQGQVGSPTPVGAYSLANSYFGSFDQVGNAAEYVEDQRFGAASGTALGGGYSQPPLGCFSSAGFPQPFEANYIGLRLASVESPVAPAAIPALGRPGVLALGMLLAAAARLLGLPARTRGGRGATG